MYRDDWDFINDNDWFAFEATSGQIYTIETSDLEWRTDTVIYLYGPDCLTELAMHDDIDYPVNKGSRIVWSAPADGTYHVDVRSYYWYQTGEYTGYTFSVTLGETAADATTYTAAERKSAPPPTPELADANMLYAIRGKPIAGTLLPIALALSTAALAILAYRKRDL